jgi:hypothetical protein
VSLVGQVQEWVKEHVAGLVDRVKAVEKRLEAVEKYIQAVEQADEIPADPAPRVASQKAATTAAKTATRGRAAGTKTSG